MNTIINKINFKDKSFVKSCIWRVLSIVYALYLIKLNYVRIFDFNLWSDECFSVKMARLGFFGMLDGTAADVHPPLYYVFVILCTKLFGESGFSLHLSAFIFYVATVIFILTFVWNKFGKESSILMLTLCSISSNAVRYNVEVRMYSLAFFMCLVSFCGLYLILKDTSKWTGYIVFVIASLGAAYSHYYAMIAVAFFYLAILILTIQKKIELKKLIFTYAVTILGYLPWLFKMLTTFARTADGFWMTDYSHVDECIESFYPHPYDFFPYALFAMTIGVVIYSIILDIRSRDKVWSIDSIWMLWGLIAALGTMLIGILISVLIQPSFITRYLYPICSAMWMVLAVGICKVSISGRPYGKYICLVLAVVSFIMYKPMYNFYQAAEAAENQRFEETLAQMRDMISSDDVILTDYYHYNLTIIDTYLPDNSHERIKDNFEAYDFDPDTQYWFLVTHEIDDEAAGFLSSHGYQAEPVIENGSFGTLDMYLYRIDKL